MQHRIAFPYSAAALEALDAIVLALLGLGPVPRLADDVVDELEDHGDLDAWDQLERETAPQIDWADRDSFDAETAEWNDRFADPYSWHDDLGVPEPACDFMLGTHRPHWLYAEGSREQRPAGPLFVSARQLRHARRTDYPRCDTPFAVDSGGFTELRAHGGWVTTPETYAAQILRLESRTQCLRWAAIQDWMVEDDALRATGLTVDEHQRRTVESFLRLRELAPGVRWLPVIQGQTLEQYVAHVDMYRAAGIRLETMSLVGVGSVCRRQSSVEIEEILRELASRGLQLHGFGVKTAGLERSAAHLRSADSLAWSLGARKRFPGAQNSQIVAEEYRARMLAIPGVR